MSSKTGNTKSKRKPRKKNQPGPLPKFAIVPNLGIGKVTSYKGKGYFIIMLPGDIELLTHRSHVKFTNKRPFPERPQTQGGKKTSLKRAS